MSKIIEPPAFVGENKSYAEYKADLHMWSRISGIDRKVQAEMVVYRLEGHPSRIKEKIMTQIGEKLQNNENGIDELLVFLDTIYTKDEMADAWDRFSEFSSFVRKKEVKMSDFVADWQNCYYRAKKVGCDYPDIILAFKLLKDANLEEMDIKLVLTGVDFQAGKEDKNLLEQVKSSLKKFKGRSVISEKDDKAVKVDETLVSEMEEVLLAKGWKAPGKSRRLSRSESPGRSRRNPNYKGKKNPLDSNYKLLKCFNCKCEHVDNCNCPCVYHFANTCPQKKNQEKKNKDNEKNSFHKDEEKNKSKKSELGLFIEANIPTVTLLTTEEEYKHTDGDLVLYIKDNLEELVLVALASGNKALIDCACPTSVSGRKWIVDFLAQLTEDQRKMIRIENSEKVFKFGGGEKRSSLGRITFPCKIGKLNVKLTAEVVETDFPLLLGNSTLKKADAELYPNKGLIKLLGEEIAMTETESGHFSLQIDPPLKDKEFLKKNVDVECLICTENAVKELTRKEIEKLHQYFGHVSQNKLENLIKKADKMNPEVQNSLRKVYENCRSCALNRKANPRTKVAMNMYDRMQHEDMQNDVLVMLEKMPTDAVGDMLNDANDVLVMQEMPVNVADEKMPTDVVGGMLNDANNVLVMQ